MIIAVAAPPGGGKSKFMCEMIGLELIRTERFIVTTVAVQFEPWVLNGVLQRGLRETLRVLGHPELAKRCHERVRIIDSEGAKRFWNMRNHAEPVETVIQDERGNYKFDFPEDKGVFYLIDEAHDSFFSHDANAVPPKGRYYITKHRHCGDDIVISSQAMSNVSKQLRVLVQFTWYVRNLGFEKLGVFTLPAYTMVKEYLYCPDTFESREPLNVTYRKNNGFIWQQCYNTAAAASHLNASGDAGKKHRRGLHWSLAFVAVIVGLVVVWWATDYFPRKIAERSNKQGEQLVMAKLGEPASASVVVGSVPAENTAGEQASEHAPASADTNSLSMVGYGRVASGFVIFMSDGSEHYTTDPHVLGLEKHRVNLSGKWYPMKRRFVSNTDASVATPSANDENYQSPTAVTPVVPGPVNRAIRLVSEGPRRGPDGTLSPAPAIVLKP